MLRGRSVRLLLGAALFAAALLAVAGLAAGSRSATVVTVSVTLTDTSVHLSKTSFVPGKVKFVVVNHGKKAHYFSVDGKRTAMLAAGKKATLLVVLKSGNVKYFESTVKKSGLLKVKAAAKAKAGGGGAAAGGSAVTDGKKVFLSAGCKSCHTLKAAGATGTIGPNLDQIKPSVATVVSFVTDGYNGVGAAVPMPSFQGQLSATQIKDVAAFVYASTH